MTHPNKQDFWEWAFDDLLSNTTRGVLAEYIVATALGICDRKRVEWDQYDLRADGFGVEVKSAAYVQAWKQTQLSKIAFGIGPTTGWDASTNTYAASAGRCVDVYVFCLLNGTNPQHVEPLDVEQWTFYVLPTSVVNRKKPEQRMIRLAPLIALGPHQCKYDELKAAIHEGSSGQSRRLKRRPPSHRRPSRSGYARCGPRKLDRLIRNMMHILQTVEMLTERGVTSTMTTRCRAASTRLSASAR